MKLDQTKKLNFLSNWLHCPLFISWYKY